MNEQNKKQLLDEITALNSRLKNIEKSIVLDREDKQYALTLQIGYLADIVKRMIEDE